MSIFLVYYGSNVDAAVRTKDDSTIIPSLIQELVQTGTTVFAVRDVFTDKIAIFTWNFFDLFLDKFINSTSIVIKRCDRTIIEGLQDIVVLLEAQLHPLVQAESSVIVDVLYRPEYLFQPGTEARKKCDNGGFIRRLIKHTERLLEDKEEKLCIQVLNTLRQMWCSQWRKGISSNI